MFQTTTATKSRISNMLNRRRNYYLFYLIATTKACLPILVTDLGIASLANL